MPLTVSHLPLLPRPPCKVSPPPHSHQSPLLLPTTKNYQQQTSGSRGKSKRQSISELLSLHWTMTGDNTHSQELGTICWDHICAKQIVTSTQITKEADWLVGKSSVPKQLLHRTKFKFTIKQQFCLFPNYSVIHTLSSWLEITVFSEISQPCSCFDQCITPPTHPTPLMYNPPGLLYPWEFYRIICMQVWFAHKHIVDKTNT